MTDESGPLESASQPKRLTTNCKACQAGPESLSRRLVAALNARDFDNPVLDHIAPNALTRLECLEASTREELIAIYRQTAVACPAYRVKVTDSTGEVDDFKGTAKIWLSLEVNGYPKNTRRECVAVLYWRISFGEWCHYRNRGLTHGGGGD